MPDIRHFDRREFIKLTGTAGAAIGLAPQLISTTRAAPRANSANAIQRLDLTGRWHVQQAGHDEKTTATVPGCIYTDLLTVGKIPDPFFRDNADKVHWIDKENWTYTRQFHVSDKFLNHKSFQLVCNGLDTLADIHINGHKIAHADNMFRTWRFDIHDALHPGNNTIEITFRSLLPYMHAHQKDAPHRMTQGRAWVRKAAYMFGWDWAPVLRGCGIWRPIEIQAMSQARLADVAIDQDHAHSGRVDLNIKLATERFDQTPLCARITVTGPRQHRVMTQHFATNAHSANATIPIHNPKLWWPNGMGDQPLYRIRIDLLDQKGDIVDTRTRRIGLRTVKLIADTDAHPLQLAVNGVAFFTKGANWVPSDSFPSRVTTKKLRHLMRRAADTHMNILRFWGGGYYEEDALYDACDELGLLVWLDFKFANTSFPVFDDSFMDNVRHEVRDNVKRLRHHPCIAVWSGNNEVGYLIGKNWSSGHFPQHAYDKLFKKLIPSELHALVPKAQYTPGSPDSGDTHSWGVWHGGDPFHSYDKVHGFVTEFGFQAFPAPETVDGFTKPKDRNSVNSEVMRFHRRDGSHHGNQLILDGIYRYLGTPNSFNHNLYLGQLVQAYSVQMGVEHWRRDKPKSTACLYWQYNDCWPCVSWSSIDYYNRPKALQYVAERLYRPVLVSATADSDGTLTIFLCNDQRQLQSGKLTYHVTDAAGHTLRKHKQKITVAPQTVKQTDTVKLNDLLDQHGGDNLLIWLRFERAGQVLTTNLATLTSPRYLQLEAPEIKTTVKANGAGFDVSLRAKHPALWAMLDLDNLDARYQDNFMHIQPGRATTIHVDPVKHMSIDQLHNRLKVRSFFDLLEPPGQADPASNERR